MISEQKRKIIQEYNHPIHWNITGFGSMTHVKYLFSLLDVCKRMGTRVPFDTVHGCFLSKFNGGRTSISYLPKNEIKDLVVKFNSYGVGVKMTLTNTRITSDDLLDPYLNFLLETLNDGEGNGVICVVDCLAEYIRENYKNLSLTASIIKTEMETVLGETDTPEHYNALCERFDEVVINTTRAFDDDFLKQLKYPEKIEVIANHACVPDCKCACAHHQLIEDMDAIREHCISANKDFRDDPEYKEVNEKIEKMVATCGKRKNNNNLDDMEIQTLNIEEINHLSELGIRRFKLEGRDHNIVELCVSIVYFILNRDSAAINMYF
jgi:collagenase-like PrtC family protease